MNSSRIRRSLAKRNKLLKHIGNEIPGFKLKSKKESRLFAILSKLMFFNKGILDRYITTIYPYVFVPSLPWKENDHTSAIEILSHEYVHLKDRRRLKWAFNYLYLSPQVLAIFSMLAVLDLRFLLCLLFLLPIPSPGRAWLEFRGYRMSMAIRYWLIGSKYNIDFLVKQFTNSGYYWMWPFEKFLRRKFEKTFDQIKENRDLPEELQEVKEVLGI